MTDATDAPWTVRQAAEHYGVGDWGNGYFGVDPAGNLTLLDPARPGVEAVSLPAIVAGLKGRGLDLPVLIRIENILEHRIATINEAFHRAVELCGYRNVYRGVFPIKVNQQRHIIEEISRFGARYSHGLEAGSKAELIIAMASLENHDSPIICNGFKDEEFVQLGLFAVQLGIRCFFVIENPSEVPIIVAQSKRTGIRPLIGVRLKLTTRVDGHWQEDSGDRSIFGLSTGELIAVIDQLKAADMLDCLQLQHAHIGSQIPNIQNVRAGVAEACRYYINLLDEGAPMGWLDMGGGLAVDYDGSASNWTHSMNYRLDEYCVDMLEAVMAALDPLGIEHPVLITESGRATVAYSSILLFDILDVSDSDPVVMAVPDDLEQPEPLVNLMELIPTLDARNLQEHYNDATYYRDAVRERFRYGEVSLRTMALAENACLQVIQRIIHLLPEVTRVPQALQDLAETMADIYYGNFSVFQSLPDTWAIDQVFPVMPIHRLDERPERIAVIADLTCDSDGRIDRFANPWGERKTLSLHALKSDEDYVLGVFLVGAYQETLGDLHNLFGDTNVASVRLDGQGGFRIESELEGDSIADVLSVVEYSPQSLSKRFRDIAEQAVRDGRLSVDERRSMLRAFNDSLGGYTYFEK